MKFLARPLVAALFVPFIFATTLRAQANQPPAARDDSYTAHGATVVGPYFSNDSDPEGGGLSDGGIVSPPANGTLQGVTADTKLYTPDRGFVGTDSFTYSVCDWQNECATATVNVTVTNSAPSANGESQIVRGVTTLAPLLSRDSDPDGDPIQLGDIQTEAIAVFPRHGTLYGTGTPDVKMYFPNYGYIGGDYFVYNVCDNLGRCAQATFTIYVFENNGAENNGPVGCGGSVGEPINVTNGNMYLEQTDLDAFVKLTRTYNSNSRRAGLFGRGWSSAYDESVEVFEDGLLRLNLGTGQAVYFASSGGGGYAPVMTDFHGALVQGGDGTFTLTTLGGETRRFTSAGKLLSTADRNGNQTVLSYDQNGKLASVTNPFGRVLTVTADPVYGHVTSISDSLGAVATYAYGPSLELTRVEYPDGSAYQFTHTYGPQGLILATVKDALDNVLESHTYDGYGRALTSEKHEGAELYTLTYVSDTETHVTDALNRTTKYFFDKSKGHSVVTGIEGPCDCGGGVTARTWTYDDGLNVLARTDGLGQSTSFTYDAEGNRLSMTNSLGTVNYTYNSFGQVLTATDAAGPVMTNTYDARGNLLATKDALNFVTTYAYNGRGQLTSATDAHSKVTSFSYDSSGDLTEKTDAAGSVFRATHDVRGRVASTTDALSQTTSYEYDAAGRLKKITSPDNSFFTATYDLAGRLTRLTDARNNDTRFAYDEAHRLVSVTNADGKVTSYTYNLMSRLTGVTDALGRTTNYEYDSYDRLSKVILPPASAGALRLEERFAYDAAGRLTGKTDRAGRTTAYEYDDGGRLAKITDPASKETRYEYDSRSHLTAVVDAVNQRYTFTPDALGRLTQFSRGGLSKSFTYDAVGNRVSRTDFNNATTTYTYDNLSRLTAVSHPDGAPASYAYDRMSRLLSATNAEGTVSFTYDSQGRLTGETDVFGIIVNYAYDGAGNRTQLKVGTLPNVPPQSPAATYQYDALNRLIGVTDAAGLTVSYGYDGVNRLTSRGLPNGVATAYEYDGLDRLTRLRSMKGAVPVADNQYRHDAAGRITRKNDLAGAHDYAYDLAGRLTSATHPNMPDEEYAYDGVGNRTSSHRAASYGYQAANRVVSVGGTSFAYDNNGNLTSKSDGSGTITYTWDYENRLTGVTPPSGPGVAYKYDALGRRVERRAGAGQWTRFTYEGRDVVRDRGSDGVAVEYLNGLGVDNKLRQASASGALYYVADHLNSTAALTDPLGNVVEQLSTDSFGDGPASALTRYGFAGREYDPSGGLYYYRARWYDPRAGRFTSEDPIGFAGGVNFYAYVANDPLNRVDPSGLNDAPYYYSPPDPPRSSIFDWPAPDPDIAPEPAGGAREEGEEAERRHFIPEDNPYSGGYRHCVSSCLLGKRYGWVASWVVVPAWDFYHESSGGLDDRADRLAEQVGLRCAEILDQPCENTCMRPFPAPF